MRGKPQMSREQLMLTEKWQQFSSLIINHTLIKHA
jgi:beta-N-acetylhexosaminidase